MSTKVGLMVEGRRFDVDVEEDFALFLTQTMATDFNRDGNNKIKTLVQAYIRKNYELFVQEENIKDILEKCDAL